MSGLFLRIRPSGGSRCLVCALTRPQDSETGGFSDRPGDVVDVFHTLFGIAGLSSLPCVFVELDLTRIGLSLLGFEGLEEVDPVYCLPRNL